MRFLGLKLRATQHEALEDFGSLATMIRSLHYPIGIFVNIASTAAYGELVPRDVKAQITSFAVSLVDGRTCVIQEGPEG